MYCNYGIINYCTIEIWGMNNFFDVWSNIFLPRWRCPYKDRRACTNTRRWFYCFRVCDCRGKYIARWCAVRRWCSCRLGKLRLRSARWYRTGRWCTWFHVGRHMWCHSWCSNRWSSCGSCWCVRGIGLYRGNGDTRIKTLHTYWGILCKMYKVRKNDNSLGCWFFLKENRYYSRSILNILLNMWLNH